MLVGQKASFVALLVALEFAIECMGLQLRISLEIFTKRKESQLLRVPTAHAPLPGEYRARHVYGHARATSRRFLPSSSHSSENRNQLNKQ